ncbi:MAG: hypothetical protein H7Y37_01750 [Anaerolineae bacterium]|nr:hypothetical protein [Gloeobacterales cyanobacterium ES-bin-313]
MEERNFADFVTIFGEEFCEALSPVVGWENITPQDSYEIFCSAFNQKPSQQMLSSLNESQLEHLRTTCKQHIEYQGITIDHVRSFVSGTLARWPVDSG